MERLPGSHSQAVLLMGISASPASFHQVFSVPFSPVVAGVSAERRAVLECGDNLGAALGLPFSFLGW